MSENLTSGAGAAHEDCWIGGHCGADDCPSAIADRKRTAARAAYDSPAWGRLEERHELGGRRHYLDGEPVHCGDGLELQGRCERSDEWGEYSVRLPSGVSVRYEASIRADGIRATLYADVAGHEFVAAFEPWMRFRWPAR